uniref:Enhancer of rudimentary homolog isoform X2 n=1 Tax=Geotrypetes seraphini TaxID=260995 RepID=A0A6P8RSJ5_GEOSA|nr:enhancer of rudimentary homolog isoform X2 [Geotrypetes seraphini]
MFEYILYFRPSTLVLLPTLMTAKFNPSTTPRLLHPDAILRLFFSASVSVTSANGSLVSIVAGSDKLRRVVRARKDVLPLSMLLLCGLTQFC